MATILVIDDNLDMRFLLNNLLTENGFFVETAEDGVIALEMMGLNKPDLVLLDLRLPKLSGLEVLQIIKEQDIHAKVILLTAYSNLGNRTNAITLGADDYLTKPFDNNELVTRINHVLNVE